MPIDHFGYYGGFDDNIGVLLNSALPSRRAVGAEIALEGAYGVAADGTAYLVANRIEKGTGRAKFMHEVGAHPI